MYHDVDFTYVRLSVMQYLGVHYRIFHTKFVDVGYTAALIVFAYLISDVYPQWFAEYSRPVAIEACRRIYFRLYVHVFCLWLKCIHF
jgi:hypothetical protein